MFEKYNTDQYYDEMFINGGDALKTRNHYSLVRDAFNSFSDKDFRAKNHSISKAFVEHGVTFTVYNDHQGTEKIFPFDPFPELFHTMNGKK